METFKYIVSIIACSLIKIIIKIASATMRVLGRYICWFLKHSIVPAIIWILFNVGMAVFTDQHMSLWEFIVTFPAGVFALTITKFVIIIFMAVFGGGSFDSIMPKKNYVSDRGGEFNTFDEMMLDNARYEREQENRRRREEEYRESLNTHNFY